MSEGVTSLASAAYKYPTTIQSTFLFVDVGGVVKRNTQEHIFNPHAAHIVMQDRVNLWERLL